MQSPALSEFLKHNFGYDSFRPLQEEIVSDILAGCDLIAILPTGAGKSICFQLPAIISNKVAVVVSPLIALMKDQVDQLISNGVDATFINSSLAPAEIHQRLRDVRAGRYRLVYVAPERLMMDNFIDQLSRLPLAFFAIDEAHCISEWGHDFRPEYRELGKLRGLFPDIPIVAFTATATERVRSDIAEQLKLKTPRIYVSSFDRPNLNISVIKKQNPEKQLVDLVSAKPDQACIVYCFSRDSTEKAADLLSASGILAAPYHAGLEKELRDRTQDRFIRDEIQVICATVAFGMGINKLDIRTIIHYDLPKHIEGYYQEIGRAGRDGLESDCILLFNPGDAVKMRRMLDGETDSEASIQKLQQMVRYAESFDCRRKSLLRYFNEEFPGNCGACDNCVSPQETEDLTVPAQKLLSTVVRIRGKSGFDFGLRHIVSVLVGENNERVAKWGHQSVSTFGIGSELHPDYWHQIGKDLLRNGYLHENPGQYPTVGISALGQNALTRREPIYLVPPQLTERKSSRKSKAGKPKGAAAAQPHDPGLYQELKTLRRRIATELGVPAYVVFSDAALVDMAGKKPTTPEQFLQVSGVGDVKLARFGEQFLSAINSYANQ